MAGTDNALGGSKVLKLADFVDHQDGPFEWKNVIKTVRDLVTCIVTILEEDNPENDIVRRGLIVLCFIGVSAEEGFATLQDASATANAIVKVLREFADNAEIQSLGLDALIFLSEHHGQTIASTIGGIHAVIVDAIKSHATNTNVAISGIRLLGFLCQRKAHVIELIQAEGMTSIALALEHHQHHQDIAFRGCKMMAYMAYFSQARRVEVIPAILKTMQQHEHNVDVTTWGCATFVNLALSPSCQHGIVEAGGILVVCKALETNRNDQSLQTFAIQALHNLVINGVSNMGLVQAWDNVGNVLTSLDASRDNLEMQRVGVNILHVLTTRVEKIKESRERNAMVRALQRAIRICPDDPNVRERGQEALILLGVPLQSSLQKVIGRMMRL
ncbi:expressed unknown protein [Seminavis robusta]|uniref:Uncharacterized protein n=1 Tax=Seminavis robusta TaxID=568900 RepID=A0A9N8DCE3_9STRA|nr:expressed unknown protein [Seminavis robusta]|eukprot:Sro32_g021030.1 n/a (387) ;mRNA; f:137770-138930